MILTTSLHAQINMADSSSQVIGYWSIGDQQSYELTHNKYKIKGSDTTSIMFMKYEVDITVKDSTASSYVIEWLYKNYEVDAGNELMRKIIEISENISVTIRTDEFGAVQEVLNWQELRDYIVKASEVIKKEFEAVPNIAQLLEQSFAMYTTKESIEVNAIKDALQFYTFHGAKYTLGEELTGQMKFANNYGGEPFDVDVTISLDELNPENDNCVLRMYQTVNSEQLTDATYNYLKQLGQFGDQLPAREDFSGLTNEIWTASRIHGGTGWTTYSIETKEVKAEGTINVEERTIQIK